MNHLVKYTSLTLTSVLALSVFATNKPELSGYELVAYKGCDVVYSMTLNEQQAAAYDNLNNESELMHKLEVPIKKMQPALDELEEQMRKVSHIAVQETEKLIRIDKQAMEKQTAIAEKIEALIQQHQSDFDAIENQGDKIQAVADQFEKLVANALPSFKDFDHIQIFTDNDTSRKCESYM